MKIVIDSKIPFIRDFAGLLGNALYIDGAKITAEDVHDADALIVRTRTRCDRQLLEGSKVRFIATATIGYDHLDTDYLKEAGIAWANCPGCNATSVAQYVKSALLLLAAHGCWEEDARITPPETPATAPDRKIFAKLTLGIVGVGNVGKQILSMARDLHFGRILLCDPPRAEHEGNSGKNAFVDLCEIARECDVVTFHTPLTQKNEDNAYPTFHMADEQFFMQLRQGAVVINSSRGEVVDTKSLKRALQVGRLRAAVVDTWENEPNIDTQLLAEAFLATPHIAGYSADGKANGTRMALKAVARHFGLPTNVFDKVAPPQLPPHFAYFPEGSGMQIADELRLYDPTRDSLALKHNVAHFEQLRGNYPLRRERDE